MRSRWPPHLPASARTRILASYVVLLLFSTVVGYVALRQVLVTRAGDRVDDALVQESREFRRLAREGRDPRTGRAFGDRLKPIFDVYLARNVPSEREIFYTFLDDRPYLKSASPRLRSRELPGIEQLGRVTRSTSGERTADNGNRYRYIAVPIRVDGRTRGVFAVVIDLGGELDEVGDALGVAAAVSLAVLLLASALAWLIAGRVLAPLADLSDTAQAISETDLTRRIEVRGDDELAHLAHTFNAMLDRLEVAFASQKSFLSDAGHELRTPITIVRGHLELMGENPDERRETIGLVMDELDRMARLVDDLLLLAKAQQSDFLRAETVDLGDLTYELHAKASTLARRQWRLGGVGSARIVADRQRLTQALMNLSQNAVEHTSEGDPIELGSRLDGDLVHLWVRDSGPGVSERDRPRIFERSFRGNGTRGEGAGLGLAICRAIAEAHGGRVDVESRHGHGARFTVVIPTEPPKEASSA
jgi:two-component system, OmpR family, sensor kinase